jgi:cation:H+ antiporter
MYKELFIFVVAFYLVIKGSTIATKYAGRLAKNFNFSKYVVGFIIVAIISILPETFISINSALNNASSLGLGMLFGSNVADLTLIFAIIIWSAKRNLKVESKILKKQSIYPFMLLLPLFFSFNGYLSRWEGIILIVVGIFFYYMTLRDNDELKMRVNSEDSKLKNFLGLLLSMAILLVGSHFIITSATSMANILKINSIIIGMLIIGLGTTIPELFFSLHSIKKHDDSLAIGDLLGTVLADATIVVGILALINPFSFPQKTVYTTGIFMVVASFILFYFMRTGKCLSKREALYLFIFWLIFAFTEIMINI